MLDRVKFMFGFFRAYRQARKAGDSPDDAKLAAARHMIGMEIDAGDRPALPARIAEAWADPATALADAVPEGGWFGSGPFEITSQHLILLRTMRFSWDGAERGAPILDPERPYGRSDLVAQLAEVFATEDADTLARRHVEMLFVLARVLRHGVLQPGTYRLRNTSLDDLRDAMRGYGGARGVSDADLALDADGAVILTEEHLKLLRGIEIRWPSQSDCEERIACGDYPAATADSKRPYGDYTYIEVDMARILDCLPPPPEGGEPAVFKPEPALAAHLQRLHWQMLGAMQAFVENAAIAPGAYDLDAAD